MMLKWCAAFTLLSACVCGPQLPDVLPETDGRCVAGYQRCGPICKPMGTCTLGTDSGAADAGCASCGLVGDTCTPSGDCRCGAGTVCAEGQRCRAGSCVCDETSCGQGCCQQSRCLSSAQQNEAVCGVGGQSCSACQAPPQPVCVSSLVRRGFATPGSCTATGCSYQSIETNCLRGCEDGGCIGDSCQGCLTPPPAECVGANARRLFLGPGDCRNGVCAYSNREESCRFGCSGGQCAADPCAQVTCNSAPAPRCLNNTTRQVFAAPGSCTADGGCSYPTQDVPCTSPPPSICMGDVARSYVRQGSCSGGICDYTSMDQRCAAGCSAGVCLDDPCTGVVCNTPPAPQCTANGLRRVYDGSGTCSNGSCTYSYADQNCDQRPASRCISETTLRSYATGACMAGTCFYSPIDSLCPFGCLNGACAPCPAGTMCSSNPNPCRRGVTDCSTGMARCVDDIVVSNGTICPGGICQAGVCCSGCVDAQGVCRPGTMATACGRGGGSCETCLSRVCTNQVCTCGCRQCNPQCPSEACFGDACP